LLRHPSKTSSNTNELANPGSAYALWSTETCGEILSVDHRSPVTSVETKQISMPPAGRGLEDKRSASPGKASAREALAF